MFIKPFHPKANIHMKASEVKKFKNKIKTSFPALTEEQLSSIFTSKVSVAVTKILTHGGENITAYSFDKRPMFFEIKNEIIPTIYTCWVAHDIVPYFTTHDDVLARLLNGADLMLPGVIKQGVGMKAYGHYKKDQIVAINLTSNQSAIATGRLARSSDDLYMSGGHGPCVKVLNIFGDNLWNLDPSVALQIPNKPPAKVILSDESDFPPLGNLSIEVNSNKEIKSEEINTEITSLENQENDNDLEENLSNEDLSEENHTDEIVEESMDDILKEAFFIAVKQKVKDAELPILYSNFYRNGIIESSRKQINMKETTYKKISNFLAEMSKLGYISSTKDAKGVEKITSINHGHEDIVNFILPSLINPNDKGDQGSKPLFTSEMQELYIVSEELAPFFTKFNYSIGQRLAATQIKKLIREYVSKNSLPYNDAKKNDIKLDECLTKIVGTDVLSIGGLFRDFISKMTRTHEMVEKTSISTGKFPIQVQVATRMGNKKVTVISNLELNGIILSELEKICKQTAAASTTIIKSPKPKQNQLQVQGNQMKLVFKILTEQYKIPPGHIQCADLKKKSKAPTKPKK